MPHDVSLRVGQVYEWSGADVGRAVIHRSGGGKSTRAGPVSHHRLSRHGGERARRAPIDVEVFSVIRRQHAAGRLDDTAATQAVMDLEAGLASAWVTACCSSARGSCGATSAGAMRWTWHSPRR